MNPDATLIYEDLPGAQAEDAAATPEGRERRRQKELAEQAAAFSGDIDTQRWHLAGLAARSKAKRIRDWAEIIGIACRRKKRTVVAWAATWEWVNSHPRPREWLSWFPYSFYETAAHYADRLADDAILHLMEQFHAEQGATLESFRAELADLCGKPDEDWGKKYRKWGQGAFDRVDHEEKAVGEQLAIAGRALTLAAELKAKAEAKSGERQANGALVTEPTRTELAAGFAEAMVRQQQAGVTRGAR